MEPFVVLGRSLQVLLYDVAPLPVLTGSSLGLIDLSLVPDRPALVLVLGVEKDSTVGSRFLVIRTIGP